MVKIKKAKDLNGDSFYFASHAQATFLDDGSTVQDQIEQIKQVTDNYIFPDLSNCVTPQQLENSLNLKQDIILDLNEIRSGALKGKSSLQRTDLSSIAFTNNYLDLANTPHVPTAIDVEEWGFVNQENITDLLNTKVDVVAGKTLSSNDFTDVLKSKLENLTNYDDSAIQLSLKTLQESFDTLVNGDTTTAIKSFNEIIAFLDGIQDSQDLSSIIANIQQQITGKADKSSLSTVATSGSYKDLSNKPIIPKEVLESTVSDWGFTKNTGTYSKPSGGIPSTDLDEDVNASLSKANNAAPQSTTYTKTEIDDLLAWEEY